MRKQPAIERLDLDREPLELLAAWAPERPVLLLHSGGDDRRRARWSIAAEPACWMTIGRAPGASGAAAGERPAAGFVDDPLHDVEAALAATRIDPAPADGLDLPVRGGWIGYLSYELGRAIEPAVAASAGRPRDEWPLLQLAWCPDALVHDHSTGAWYAVGTPAPPEPPPAPRCAETAPPPALGAWSSTLSPDAYVAAVTRTLEYIGAGDVFQANVTQRLSSPFAGSTRALARTALAASGAWYGAYLELPGGRTLVSMSPELFLEVEPRGRRVRSRPIKGTRPRRVDPRDLARSEKDAAELHMIVDLMRNDLGRVCCFGTVEVPVARTIETHGTVHHGVGEVTGTLRDAVSVTDLLRATFPAGSVTGAPKIRAMQIIETLEPAPRGPYCGAVGFISDHGAVGLNVAIRTMLLQGDRPPGRSGELLNGVLDYGVGGGIVADSEPLAEYRESLDKAAVLAEVLPGTGLPTPFGARSARRPSAAAAACR